MEAVARRTVPDLVGALGELVATRSQAPARIERLPDATATLLVREAIAGPHELFVVGPLTRALLKVAAPWRLSIQVEIRAGAAQRVLGVPARVLVDRIVRLDELWGARARRLEGELHDARGLDDKLTVLIGALRQRVHAAMELPAATLARRALAMLDRQTGEPRIAEIAETLGVSARHLRRVFREAIGISPKELARMRRLRRAIGAAHGGAAWSIVAAAAGYYDQAHLIGEFRRLVGTTPERWRASQRTVTPS